MKKFILLIMPVFLVLNNFINAESPKDECITVTVYRNDQLSSKDKKEKLKGLDLPKGWKQLTSADMEQITFVFKNYTDSLCEKTSNNELFEIISAKGLAIIEDGSYGFEERNGVFESETQLVLKARKLLARQGDPLIEQLLIKRTQGYHSNEYIMNSLKILSEIGTPKAKRTLLDIIDSKMKGWDSKWGLTCYLKIINVEEARELLSSRGDDILKETVRKFPELVKEPAVFNLVSKNLQSKDLHERLQALYALMRLTPDEMVPDRVDAIAESLNTIREMPNSDQRYSKNMTVGTRSDVLYAELCRGLWSLSNADYDLARITNKMEGLARKWIIVTRAKRGDASVKEEVISILKDQSIKERTILRLSAVNALGEIGSSDDIPFLKYMSENDTYEFWNRGGPLLEKVDGVVVNNTGEQSVAVREEITNTDLWTDASKSYPIREAARVSVTKIQNQNK